MTKISYTPYLLRRFTIAAVVGLTALLGNSAAWACSVPVFRYALEHWRSDPYQVIFFHRGKMSAEEEALLSQLSQSGQAGKISANVEVIPVDLDAASPDDPQTKDDLALWERQPGEKSLPWMVVQYPLSFPVQTTIWAGVPSKESIGQILESPKRREITKRILAGQTAVWVFLESGDKDKDEQALLTLRNELKKCEQQLQLPEADPQDVANGLISVEQASLKINFSVLPMSKTDPAEMFLIDSFLDSEEGLRDPQFAGPPMVFPVFGRGRSLYAIIGKGIEQSVIFDACRFLVGPCSCQVKQQNPGTDLLMAVNWDQAVSPQIAVDTSLPPLPVFSPESTGGKPSKASTVAAATVAESAQPKEPGHKKPAAAIAEQVDNSNNAGESETKPPAVAESTEAAPKALGSRVMSITLLFLAAAVGGIAVISVFFGKIIKAARVV